MLLYVVVFIILLAIDFIVKQIVAGNMQIGDTIAFWPEVFHITYVRNTGAAFSFFEGKTYLLALFSAIVMAAILIYILKIKPKHPVLLTSLTLILSGGIGNLIDRVFYGSVIDFFDFRLINFAIFNTADIYVVCGTALMIFYALFLVKEGTKPETQEDKAGEK